MAGSENTTNIVIGSISSSLDGQTLDIATDFYGKIVTKAICCIQRNSKELLRGSKPEEGYQKLDCEYHDILKHFLNQIEEQNEENLGHFWAATVKVLAHYIIGEASHARETLADVCMGRYDYLSLNKVPKNVADVVMKVSFKEFTKASICDGLILLSCNQLDTSCKVDMLNLLGILAVELSMPHKANEIFQFQREQLNEHSESADLLEKLIVWNNNMISCVLSGQIISDIWLLDDVRKMVDSVKERYPVALEMCAVVLNNLGKVNLDMGNSHQAENFFIEAAELLEENGCVTTQQQAWKIIVHYNIFRLYFMTCRWKIAQETLELIEKSVLLLDIDDKSQINGFILAEQVQLDLKINRHAEANKNFEELLPILIRLNLWTPAMIFEEIDIIFLIKIAKILQLLGKVSEARDILKKVSEVCHAIFESDHVARAEALYRCGKVYCLLEDYRESVVLVIKAAKIYENLFGNKHPRLISLYCKLAHVQVFHLEEKREAKQNVERAFSVLEHYPHKGNQIQYRHLKKLVKAGILDSCLLFDLDNKSIDVSLSHEKLFSDQPAADDVKVNLKCEVTDFDFVVVSCKIMLKLPHLGRPLIYFEEAVHSSKAKESLSSQMLLYSCLGFLRVSANSGQNRDEGSESLNEALEIAQKVVASDRDKSESNVILSSLALVVQAFSILGVGSKKKELMDVSKNMESFLLHDESKEFSDVYTHVVDGKMLYLSVQEVLCQERSVTVSVVVNEDFSMANSSTSRSFVSYQPTVNVHCLNGETDNPRILVLAKCCHKVDIEVLRSLSRSVSQSLKESSQSGVMLTKNFVVDIKTFVSMKSSKSLCQEVELALPLFMSEMSQIGYTAHSGLSPLCSNFVRFTCTRVFSPEILMSRFLVSSILQPDRLGVLSDLSFRTDTLYLFLEQPKAGIQLHCMGDGVELRTNTFQLGSVAESNSCPCSTFIQAISHILLESSASVGVKLDTQVESRCCSTHSEPSIERQMSLSKVSASQQLALKDEEIKRDPLQDMKSEIQVLRQCLKRSTANVAVLQGVIEGLVVGKLKQIPTGAEGTSNDPTFGSAGETESPGYLLRVKGDGKSKLSRELIYTDSGIDSSDNERKRLKYDDGKGEKKLEGILVGQQDTHAGDATELGADRCKEDSSVPGKINHKDFASDCFEVTTNCLPQSSSTSESEDSFSEEGTSSIRKKNLQTVPYRMSIKHWCKSGKQRSATSLQHTVHRLERKLEQMTKEMKEMEKNYGEALFERDSAFRMIEKLKFNRELKQKRKRDRGCMSADDERFEDCRSGPGSFDDGSGDNSDQRNQGCGQIETSQDYSQSTVGDTKSGHDTASAESPRSKETKLTGVKLVQVGKEILMGNICSEASLRLDTAKSYSAAADSSEDVDDGGQDGDVQKNVQFEKAAGSSKYQDIGKEDFDKTDSQIGTSFGNNRNLHKGLNIAESYFAASDSSINADGGGQGGDVGNNIQFKKAAGSSEYQDIGKEDFDKTDGRIEISFRNNGNVYKGQYIAENYSASSDSSEDVGNGAQGGNVQKNVQFEKTARSSEYQDIGKEDFDETYGQIGTSFSNNRNLHKGLNIAESYSAASDSSNDEDGGGQGGDVGNNIQFRKAAGSSEYQDIRKEDFDKADGQIGTSFSNNRNLHKGINIADSYSAASDSSNDVDGCGKGGDVGNNIHFRKAAGSSEYQDIRKEDFNETDGQIGTSLRNNQYHDKGLNIAESDFAACDSSEDVVGVGQGKDVVHNSQFRKASGSSEYQDVGKEDYDETDGQIGNSFRNIGNLYKGLANTQHTDNFTEVNLGSKQEPLVLIGNSASNSNLQMKDLKKTRGLTVADCKLGSVADNSEKLDLKTASDEITRNVSSCQFVGTSQQRYGDVAKVSLDTKFDVTKEVLKKTGTDTMEPRVLSTDDHSFKKQSTVETIEIPICRPVKSGLCQRLTEKETLDKKEECKTSKNFQYCQFLMDDKMQRNENEQPQLKSKTFFESKDDDDDSFVTDGGAAVPCGKQIQGDEYGATVKVEGRTEILSTKFSDEPSKQVYIEQGTVPMKNSFVSSNSTTTDVKRVENDNSFFEQGARPKEFRRSAHQRACEPSGMSDSYLSNSPENTGLQLAFLARHTRDFSLSLHNYQGNNDLHLSTFPFERSINRPSSLLNSNNFQSVSSNNSDSVVAPDVQRYLWEVSSNGNDQKLVDITQQSRTFNHVQSDDHFQSASFANNIKDPQNETTGFWNTTSPFSGNNHLGSQSQSDSHIPGSDSKTLEDSSSAARNNNLVEDHRISFQGSSHDNRQKTTKRDSNTNNTSNEKIGKRNVEELSSDDKLQVRQLENGSGSSKGSSLDSVKDNSFTLESHVAEACTAIKKLCMEKKARNQKAKQRVEKEKVEYQQVLKEDEAGNLDHEEIASERQEEEASSVSTNLEPEGSNVRYPVQESPEWLCEHYRRRCKVKFACCNVYHACHRCHNSDDGCSNEEAKAHDATHVQCLVCNEEQPVTESYDTQTCQSCGTKLSEYFCPKCKHFTGTDKKPYHCDKCGICRIHKDRSFHCEICNVCLDKRLEGKHKCRPDSGHDECCICLEDAFSGCQILPCSHKVHRDCAIAMIRNGIRTCPVCRHPLYSENER